MENSIDDMKFIDSVPICPDYINSSFQNLLPNDINEKEKEDTNNINNILIKPLAQCENQTKQTINYTTQIETENLPKDETNKNE